MVKSWMICRRKKKQSRETGYGVVVSPAHGPIIGATSLPAT